ncbi:hypothetical protein [Gilvimarinus polysaccharolyticus]|uniref:hypothetical protein n=1 Tax=Gilvimarinus polysaccharolyticus TaxID=863921 RepID=UPI0012FA9B37|nr:hypothetical protein [Gilvimarinus polysaccharolyticus]
MIVEAEPPKGMRTVYSDNVPVGYITDSNDSKKMALLAQELLKEKGLWNEISKAKRIFDQAQSFANTSAYLYEHDLKKRPRNPQSICPFVVNSAFAAEMYLKCLQEINAEITDTHILTSIFKTIPNKIKDKINKKTKELECQYEVKAGTLFKDHLKNINHAFVQWRYVYENNADAVNIPQVILVLHVLYEVSAIELGIKT